MNKTPALYISKKLLNSYLFLAFVFACCKPDSQTEAYQFADLPDVRIHYTEKGEGFPLILIHGSLTDLRYWEAQDTALSKHYRVIMYSRRYNYPNQNKTFHHHSAIDEAHDLLALMNTLDIEQAHILGHSYGAYTALWFALENPERVKKLVLAEPPIMRWLPDIPGGEGIMEHFMENTWHRLAREFTEQGEMAGIEATAGWYFGQSLDSIQEIWRGYFIDNAKEWHALTISEDAFPMIDYESVRNFVRPTLILSGALSSGNFNDLIDTQLEGLLPNNERNVIENAGHEMFLDNPQETNLVILNFLNKP